MSAKPRKMLFMPYDDGVAELYSLAAECSKLCMVVWAYEYSEKYVELFEEYCDDDRVRRSRETSYLWSKGVIKMPEARREILAAHMAAKESGNEVAEAAARAVAHAASTVHSERHAFGLALYGLTALAKKYGKDSKEVKEEEKRLLQGLMTVSAEKKYLTERWARFLERGEEKAST